MFSGGIERDHRYEMGWKFFRTLILSFGHFFNFLNTIKLNDQTILNDQTNAWINC